MSVKLMTLVFQADLPPSEQAVLMACADHADDDGTGVYPSVERLAYKTNREETTVRRALRKLEHKAILVAEKRGGHGPRSTTLYTIIVGNIPLKLPFNEWCALRKAGTMPALDEDDAPEAQGGHHAPHKAGTTPPIRRALSTNKAGTTPPNPSENNHHREPSVEPTRVRARTSSPDVSSDRLAAAFELDIAPDEEIADPSPPLPPAPPVAQAAPVQPALAPAAHRKARVRTIPAPLAPAPKEEYAIWRELVERLAVSAAMKQTYFRSAKLFRMPDDSWLLVAPSVYSADLISRFHETVQHLLQSRLRRPVLFVIRAKSQAPSIEPMPASVPAGKGVNV